MSPISSFHRASVPDSLCEARPLVEAEASGGNGRREARWTDASCWRWSSDSARPSHVLRKLLGVSKATDVCERGFLAASRRPAGWKVGMSALMGELGTHASALCSEPKNRPKIRYRQILELNRGGWQRENTSLE